MPCFHPLKGYRSKELSPNGKRPIVFNPTSGYRDLPVSVPCGQCVGCRFERSRQWAVRCVHEASLYSDNCFITLTYNDQHLPADQSLDVRVFQKFMKRLRKRFGEGIRFFHCGEYGEKFGRPHYHACLFNFDFPDKELWKIERGNRLYISKSLSELWPYGFVTIGEVTFESAAYVARYILGKMSISDGSSVDDVKKFDEKYMVVNLETGEYFYRKLEYTTMSRRPGIGKSWFDSYHADVYPDDFIVINGKKVRPPKYYDSQFEIAYPSDFKKVKSQRKRDALLHVDNNTPERLKVREKIQLLRLDQLKRSVDMET